MRGDRSGPRRPYLIW